MRPLERPGPANPARPETDALQGLWASSTSLLQVEFPGRRPLERPDNPSKKLASGLPGLPTTACGTGSSVACQRALGSRAALPAGFGAFALLDGPGLTQFRV